VAFLRPRGTEGTRPRVSWLALLISPPRVFQPYRGQGCRRAGFHSKDVTSSPTYHITEGGHRALLRTAASPKPKPILGDRSSGLGGQLQASPEEWETPPQATPPSPLAQSRPSLSAKYGDFCMARAPGCTVVDGKIHGGGADHSLYPSAIATALPRGRLGRRRYGGVFKKLHGGVGAYLKRTTEELTPPTNEEAGGSGRKLPSLIKGLDTPPYAFVIWNLRTPRFACVMIAHTGRAGSKPPYAC
jgi:hypothetical protein